MSPYRCARVVCTTLGLAVVFIVSEVDAAASDYLHAASCQEVGRGESGAIDRSYYRITNAGAQPVEVICPVPTLDGAGNTGSTLTVEVNVNDHHSGGNVKASICRRDKWGDPVACDEVSTTGTEGFASLVLQLDWAPSSYYTVAVQLPANGSPASGNYTRFHTYRVVRH
jgi:hypothetical protein